MEVKAGLLEEGCDDISREPNRFVPQMTAVVKCYLKSMNDDGFIVCKA